MRNRLLAIATGVVLIVALVLGLARLLLDRPAQPTRQVRLGERLVQEDFSRLTAWERYTDPEIGANFRVEDGVYRAEIGGGSFMWGLNARLHTDVVIDVQTTQLNDYDDNSYGVLCRADPDNNGTGYYFLISGDGLWTIRRNTTSGRDMALIDYTRSDAIATGRSINRLRAVCIGSYLALYINDRFVGEVYDDTFAQGFAGLTAAVSEGGSADIAFDNLDIYSAALAEGGSG